MQYSLSRTTDLYAIRQAFFSHTFLLSSIQSITILMNLCIQLFYLLRGLARIARAVGHFRIGLATFDGGLKSGVLVGERQNCAQINSLIFG